MSKQIKKVQADFLPFANRSCYPTGVKRCKPYLTLGERNVISRSYAPIPIVPYLQNTSEWIVRWALAKYLERDSS